MAQRLAGQQKGEGFYCALPGCAPFPMDAGKGHHFRLFYAVRLLHEFENPRIMRPRGHNQTATGYAKAGNRPSRIDPNQRNHCFLFRRATPTAQRPGAARHFRFLTHQAGHVSRAGQGSSRNLKCSSEERP
ncbi:hypothetical protein [Azotobacter salinestris]|uniref:hypothetical protein n=1 Tax=Azotobacter salinestris TaxID=69964 RepID=UPI0032E04184